MKNFIIISILIFSMSLLFSDLVELSENQGLPLFKAESAGLEWTRVEFHLDGYLAEQVEVDGTEYISISYPEEGEFIEIGMPALPRFSRLIAIPDEGEVSVDIVYTDTEILSDIKVFPRQNLRSESQPLRESFTIDQAYYNNGAIFPGKIVELDSPAILRDYRVVSLTINPFNYDPVKQELEIVKSVEVIVQTNGRGGDNIRTGERKISRFFEPIYQSVILNYETAGSRDEEYLQPNYLFIYPNNSTILPLVNELAEWKHQKGFHIVTASTTVTGTSLSSIKSYLQNAYNNWEITPEFVCLVGDAGGTFSIPTSNSGGGDGDQYYALLEGNDILADIIIGRLSYSSAYELQTILGKIFNYERNPYLGETDWYHNALLTGDPSSSGQSTITTCLSIKELIESYNPSYDFDEVYNSPFASQMNNSLNSGVSYFIYRGYIGMSGWNTTGHNNGYKLYNAVILTCGTGNFSSGTGTSESLLRLGSPSAPKGAVTAIGTATSSTHTCFNNSVTGGIFHGIFAEHIYNMGGALNRGKLNLYLNYPQNPNNHVTNFSYWNNLMGDPGMELWTGIPQNLVVTYPEELGVGSNFVEVNVTNQLGMPLEGAWVTALLNENGNDIIFATDYTDQSGNIILPIAAEVAGEVKLTVTLHNHIPHLGSFELVQSDVNLSANQSLVDDDNNDSSSGNGDGQINPGEDIELKVRIKNFGTVTATGVTAELSCDDPLMTITDGEEIWGTINSGTSVFCIDDFDFSVDPAVLGGSEFQFDLTISDATRTIWEDHLFLTVAGANLYPVGYTVIDGGNQLLDPGETAELLVTLGNLGSVAADDVYGTISCADSRITFEDDSGYFGTINAGGQANNSGDAFSVTANSQIVAGSQYTLELQLYNGDGYDHTVSFLLEVGQVTVNDPLGPDTYGYYCYDDGDTDYYNVPVYDWIEIDPAYGGSGTTIPMNDPGNMGAIQEIDLPFTLKFYGEEYNTITICSNGWLAPGSNGSKSFMNWNIPGPNGPSPMIAPFWDDLKTGSGHVCYFFDPANHYFVVEWSHLQNEYNNAEETFQVIIYDILFYPTTFTDNEFKFQYKVINNVDAGDYSWSINHGQYATVGIEDHTGLRGLEYTFNNTYPTAAKHLQNQMALLFTGPPIAPEEPFLVLNGISISDENGNGNPDYGENIDLTVTVNNLGENAATGVTAQLNSGDEYIEILQDFSELNDINGGSSGSNLTAFNLDIAQNCPNGHPVIFEIEISSNEMVWILNFTLTINAPELNYSHLLINDGDNTILDPGETADMLVYFSNEGAADAYEAVLEISTADTLLTLNSDVFDFGALQAGDTEASFFSVSAHPQSPIGHICTVNWLITAEMGITAEGSFPVVISQVPVMMTEYFTSFPPDGWMIENSENWVQGNSSHAGGSSPEAQFDWYPSGSGEHRLCSMPINTLGSNELILEFKHMVDHFSGDYTLKVQTSGSSNSWHDVITYGAGDMPATQESLTVSTPDVGSEDFRLAFTFSGDSYNIDHWYIDDVILQNGNNTPVGYIAGNVALDGGSGNIADVQVNAGEESVNPNQNGYYIIGIAPGTYTLTGYLPGYGVFTIGNIEVIAIQTVTIDFTLSYLNPPTDLSAEVNENDVTLEWIEPVRYSNKSESTKTPTRSDIVLNNDNSSSQRNFIAYLVYRNDEEIIQLSDPEQTLYTDSDLENGQYSYKISALYSEGESLSTDPVLVEVDYSDTNNDILPVKTELGMNYPNPFNPETVISFSLAETNLTSLYIYNIKGEKIAELVNDTLLPGEYQAIWSGKDDSGNSVPSGIYLYHLNAGKKSFTRKMMLLK